MKQKTIILVIDDDLDILDAMQLMLEEEGFTVITSHQPHYIQELISEKKPFPDLILLDILLSGQDGRILCKQLKNNTKTKHIPVLLVSAHPSAKESATTCAADGFIEKPFKIETLLSMIAMFIQ